VTSLVPGSQRHRALWDTVGTALLVSALISDSGTGSGLTLTELLSIAGPPATEQASLFDPLGRLAQS